MMEFAASSTAFRRQSLEDTIRLCQESKIALEFSSGLKYSPTMEDFFLKTDLPRLPHNYFPAPEKPFVLNLASLNLEVRETSIQHCLNGLRLAAEVGAPFYSAHAGFCMDPKPSDLGEKLPEDQMNPREDFWKVFVASTRRVTNRAQELGIQFLVENNVVSRANLRANGTHGLLCAETEEAVRLLEEVGSQSLSLLLDTGHLKVSSQTIGFDPEEYIRACGPKIRAIHHSDNNGRADTNHPIGQDYWFLKYMPDFKKAFHILEVHDQEPSQILNQFRLLEKASEQR